MGKERCHKRFQYQRVEMKCTRPKDHKGQHYAQLYLKEA